MTTAAPPAILLRQATKRVLWVLTTVLAVVSVAAFFLQHAAMDKYARSIVASLEHHYTDRILLLEQDWQESAIRLHARIEFLNLFGNTLEEGWATLRVTLTQENHDLFPLFLVVGADDRILFKYQSMDVQLPAVFPGQGLQGWFEDKHHKRLFRWFAQPLWLGSGGKGRLLMFIAMDNGLLFRNAMPLADLFLVRQGQVLASSTGKADDTALVDRYTTWWQEGIRFDQTGQAWGSPKDNPPRLVIRHQSEPLFSANELLLVGLATLSAVIFLLWMTLGLWILRITRRITTLGQLSREFTEGAFSSTRIQTALEAVKSAESDEISHVAESLAHLTRTVDHHTRAMEENTRKLQESKERFHSLTNSLRDAIVAFDTTGIIHYCNQEGEATFTQTGDTLLNKHITTLFPSRWQENRWQDKLLPKDNDRESAMDSLESVAKRATGEEFPVEISISQWTRGTENFYTAVIRDISERRNLEHRDLRAYVNRVAISALLEIGLESLTLRRKLEVALEIILTVPWLAIQRKGSIFLVTADNHLEMVVQKGLHPHLLTSCRRIPFGYCLCGRAAAVQEIIFSKELDHRHDVTFEGIAQHGHYCVPIMLKGELLGVLNLYVDHHHVYDPEEEAFLSTIANTLAGVVDRGLVEERIHHIASHDALTNLPNRMLFKELLEQELKRAVRQQTRLAVGFFDLDHFKEVNDSLGHDAGDALLKAVAERVKSCLRESDTLARMGGDEFTLILPEIGDPEHARLVGDKIVQTLQQPFVILETPCQIGASLGISLYPDHGHSGDMLLQKADQAMYSVKRHGRNAVAIHNQSMDEEFPTADQPP